MTTTDAIMQQLSAVLAKGQKENGTRYEEVRPVQDVQGPFEAMLLRNVKTGKFAIRVTVPPELYIGEGDSRQIFMGPQYGSILYHEPFQARAAAQKLG